VTTNINFTELIPLDIFLDKEPIAIDLVYANANHPRNIFKEALYHGDARLWAHKHLAAITLLTARILQQKYGWVLEIQDCLRTIDTQTAMQETTIVKAHPEWGTGSSRLLAPAGAGGHPRGMAIDVGPLDTNRIKIDMGTSFDHMDKTSARDYKEFSAEILGNRQKLEITFMASAKTLGFPFLALPCEWWDFRFPSAYYNQYTPLSDADLPPQMQMTNKIANNISDFDDAHFQKLADSILALVERAYENI
jgi:D-alanyl-D-alanine dipeptidase